MKNKNIPYFIAAGVLILAIGIFILSNYIKNDSSSTIDTTSLFSSPSTDDLTEIKKVLTDKYEGVLSEFTITKTRTFLNESYAFVLLNKTTEDFYDEGEGGLLEGYNINYRVILWRDGNSWNISSGPDLLVTTPDHPNIPSEYLDHINRQ